MRSRGGIQQVDTPPELSATLRPRPIENADPERNGIGLAACCLNHHYTSMYTMRFGLTSEHPIPLVPTMQVVSLGLLQTILGACPWLKVNVATVPAGQSASAKATELM